MMRSITATQIVSLSQVPQRSDSPWFIHRPRVAKPNPFFSSNRPLFSTSNFRHLQATLSSSPENHAKEKASSLRDICRAQVPEHVLHRMEEVGYIVPTDVQQEALPILFSRRDCILHAQTGSGKTLTYLLLIFSVINPQRSSVQALIVVPTRELGMQVTKVARNLAAKPMELKAEQKSYTVMALLDGGMLRRHKSWLKAEPPTIVVATIGSLCQMLDKQIFKLDSMQVDFIFYSSNQVSSLRKLLTSFSSCNKRQTVFASASIPHHRRFLHDCIQQKWTKNDVVHVHVNPVRPMPSCLVHRFVICSKKNKHQMLLHLLESDAPESGIIFANEQSEKSKKAGNSPSTILLIEFLKTSYQGPTDILILEEGMNFNSRATSLLFTFRK